MDLEHLAPHDLRRTCAKLCHKAAQERLGHSRPDILLKHYTHVLDESADMAAETLSGHLTAKFRPLQPFRQGLMTFEAPIGNHIGNQRVHSLDSIVVSY